MQARATNPIKTHSTDKKAERDFAIIVFFDYLVDREITAAELSDVRHILNINVVFDVSPLT